MKYKMLKLSDIGNIITGNTPPKKNKEYYLNGVVPFVKPNNFNTSTISILSEADEKLSLSGAKAGRMVEAGTVLVTCIGTIGSVGIASRNICFNQQINAIEPNPDIINNRYLAYAITKRRAELKAIANAPVVPIINKTQFSAFEIPVPSLETQKKIVEVLDKAQELIDARKEQIRLMDELIQSVFYDMFGDPVTNPKGWEVGTVGKYITTLTDYHANGSYKILKENVELLDEPNFALMIRTTDLENDKYDNDVKYITKEAYNFLAKSKVYAEDLIINKIGSAGKVYYMPELNRPVSLGMNQFLVRTNKLLESKYLYYLFNTPTGESLILSKVRGAVTKSITKDAIREILIPIPNINIQKEFVELVRRLEVEMNQMKAALEEHRKCFNVIMNKLFI